MRADRRSETGQTSSHDFRQFFATEIYIIAKRLCAVFSHANRLPTKPPLVQCGALWEQWTTRRSIFGVELRGQGAEFGLLEQDPKEMQTTQQLARSALFLSGGTARPKYRQSDP
jgi:hypothetical protein